MAIDIQGILEAGKDGALSTSGTSAGDRLGKLGNPRNAPTRKLNFWEKTNTSYSGCDINAMINLNGRLLQIGNLSTLSYSIHREKQPVRTLGRIYPKTYVRGPLTCAGSLVFTVFDEHVLSKLRDVFDYEHNITEMQKSLLPHQLPPFDIVVTYNNEYGHQSFLRLYGVEIMDEGQTHSVNDMVSENMMQYVAKDIDLMIKSSEGLTHANLTFEQMMFNSDRGQAELQNIGVKDRDRIRKMYSEYQNLIEELKKEIRQWEEYERTNDTTNLQYLRIYRQGEVTTLSEAKLLLKEAELNLKDLENVKEQYTNQRYAANPVRDTPFDYSVQPNKK